MTIATDPTPVLYVIRHMRTPLNLVGDLTTADNHRGRKSTRNMLELTTGKAQTATTTMTRTRDAASTPTSKPSPISRRPQGQPKKSSSARVPIHWHQKRCKPGLPRRACLPFSRGVTTTTGGPRGAQTKGGGWRRRRGPHEEREKRKLRKAEDEQGKTDKKRGPSPRAVSRSATSRQTDDEAVLGPCPARRNQQTRWPVQTASRPRDKFLSRGISEG